MIRIIRVPQWINEQLAYGSDLIGTALYWYTIYTRKREMKQLRGGYLFIDILERAERKANGKLNNYDLWMYFAHDTTISALLDTLDLFSPV